MNARTSRFGVLGACVVSTTALIGCGHADDAGDDDDTATVRSEYRVTASAPWIERHALTIDQLNSELGAWQTGGYRPTYINGYAYNGADYYNAIWQKDSTMDVKFLTPAV
jgi:hypothetical protein